MPLQHHAEIFGILIQLNLLRCFILPLAYGIFLAVAQVFLIKPNHVCLSAINPVCRPKTSVPVLVVRAWLSGTYSLIGRDV